MDEFFCGDRIKGYLRLYSDVYYKDMLSYGHDVTNGSGVFFFEYFKPEPSNFGSWIDLIVVE